MADVRPFVCCRPRVALAADVAALPYDVFNRHEASAEIEKHPLSFLRIDKTAALFPDTTSEYDLQVYAKAAGIFNEDIESGVFEVDEQPYYYLYRLQKDGHSQIGITACIAIEDYFAGVLKRHENTRHFKLEDRIKHIEALSAQTGPVLVTYRAHELIDNAVERIVASSEPLYDFISPDNVRHTMWRVDDQAASEDIQNGFSSLDAMYIADGHHRAAAACNIGKERGGAGGSDYFMMVAFPSDQLKVMDYNRVVFDKNELSSDELLQKIKCAFSVEKVGKDPQKPSRRGEFAMYLDNEWYMLSLDEALRPADAVRGLDVSLLHELLLDPILGVDDPRSSKRIAYVGGVRGLEELKRRSDQARPSCDKNTEAGGGVAFALYPCSLDELFAVADDGQLMPPKSTWFEPKPRSGLFMNIIK